MLESAARQRLGEGLQANLKPPRGAAFMNSPLALQRDLLADAAERALDELGILRPKPYFDKSNK